MSPEGEKKMLELLKDMHREMREVKVRITEMNR